jgi:hypothetical protein
MSGHSCSLKQLFLKAIPPQSRMAVFKDLLGWRTVKFKEAGGLLKTGKGASVFEHEQQSYGRGVSKFSPTLPPLVE